MKQLSEFETLEEAKVYTAIDQKLLTSNQVERSFFISELHDYLMTSVTPSIVFVRNVLGRDGEFDFREHSEDGQLYIAMLDATIATETDISVKGKLEGLKNLVLAQANEIITPYANISQVTFNRAKGVSTEKGVSGIAAGNAIIITLNEPLPEECSATLWNVEDGFEDENLGRPAYLKQGINKYKIKTRGLQLGVKTVVRIPLENFDFSVEAV